MTISSHGHFLINSFASGAKQRRRSEMIAARTVSQPTIQDVPTTIEGTHHSPLPSPPLHLSRPILPLHLSHPNLPLHLPRPILPLHQLPRLQLQQAQWWTLQHQPMFLPTILYSMKDAISAGGRTSKLPTQTLLYTSRRFPK